VTQFKALFLHFIWETISKAIS